MRWRKRKDPIKRDKPESRFQAQDTAASGRHSDRAGGIGSKRDIGRSTRDRDGRPARRAARNAMASKWVNWRPVVFVHAGSSEGEFGEIGFADDVHFASPGGGQAPRVADCRPIRPGYILRSGGRHFSFHVDVVFNRKPKFPFTASRPI